MTFREPQLLQGSLRGAAFYDPPEVPPTTFGNVWTFLGNDDYYAVQANHIVPIPGTDDFLLGNQTGHPDGGLKRIEIGNPTEIWEYDPQTNIQIGTNVHPGIVTDGVYAWVMYRYSTVYRLDRVSVDDGIQDWTAFIQTTSAVALSDAGRVFLCATTTSARGLDGLSATTPSVDSYTLTGTGGAEAACVTADGKYLAYLDTSEKLQFRAISGDPGSGAWAADTEVDMLVDPSVPWGQITSTAHCVPGGGSTVWVSSRSSKEVYKFDAATGTELAKVVPDDDFVVPTLTGANAICTDKEFNLYAGTNVTTSLYIAKYDSDGALITSNELQEITTAAPTNNTDIAVSFLTGIISIVFGDGSVSSFSVAQ